MKADIATISEIIKLVEGSGKTHIVLPHGTKLAINALYSSKIS